MRPARRRWLLVAAAAWLPAGAARATASWPRVEVWKSPGCGCCRNWVRLLQREGFEVQAHDLPDSPDLPMRERLGVALRYGACHTAQVQGYALEGHVPARDIRRLLHERPSALGLAVPGMPIGSPGIDDPLFQGRRDPYDVLLLRTDGTARVFAQYR